MLSNGTAIYVIGRGLNEDTLIRQGVESLAASFNRVLVVIESEFDGRFRAMFEALDNVTFLTFATSVRTPLAGMRQGLLALFEEGATDTPVLVTGSHVLAPLCSLGPDGFDLPEGSAVMAPYWHDCSVDPRIKSGTAPDRAPQPDFTLFAPHLLADSAFQTFWTSLKPSEDPWRDIEDGVIGMAKVLEQGGHVVSYPMDEALLGSSEPRYFEPAKLVQGGSPCLPVSVMLLDPLLHDLSAVDLRGALDWMRANAPGVYDAAIRFATRHVKLRDFCTVADQYEVLPTQAANPAKDEWSFGPVAVFIHAYYAEMMPEFWELISRLPNQAHLFITTATEDNAEAIRAFLADHDWPEGSGEVRVVEQNRGRDMSSLFITWKDVALSGHYEVALRLHSKRTPQVALQVGESFKAHLFDNLMETEGYVRNVLDIMEHEPDIGLVVPPVIHVGFGTLGHAWYNNKSTLSDLAKQMYIDVPLDDDTPVGAYGTMFWFRPDALFKMFDWGWKWDDYNAEPHHIDGGLAHIQERLIAYAVQDRGYRTMQIMTPGMAGRYYGKLEYKAQMFASAFASNNVMDQRTEVNAKGRTFRGAIYRRLRENYGRMLRRWPQSRALLRPFKNAAVSVLMRR
ncbi:MAG: rhamnan synthesis F family protein [Sulfitobacter sp.]|uniref:rhamnan synthesis F family protein n=1 Tax=Sulfitobacter sp. TaxID=1903071 RepID=UPI004058C683